MPNVNRSRGFEIVTNFEDKVTHIPQRATSISTGYDIYPLKDQRVVIPAGSLIKMETGLKAYMKEREWLDIRIRSNFGIKGLRIKDILPVIDSDYYNNPDNEGHIYIYLLNESSQEFVISPEEPYAQGIFLSHADNDNPINQVRKDGFESTHCTDFKEPCKSCDWMESKDCQGLRISENYECEGKRSDH